jgi:hypothetical protein
MIMILKYRFLIVLCTNILFPKSMNLNWLIYIIKDFIDLLCLMPLPTIFQLYHGDQF